MEIVDCCRIFTSRAGGGRSLDQRVEGRGSARDGETLALERGRRGSTPGRVEGAVDVGLGLGIRRLSRVQCRVGDGMRGFGFN